MTLGLVPRQADLFRSTATLLDGRVAPDSVYGILHRECSCCLPCAGSTPRAGWTSITRGSWTRYRWTFGRGWPGRRGRTGSAR